MSDRGVGATLRHARESQGLSLGDIADRTNISPHLLAAIERDALEEVPGGLFTRGYLRAYAGEVGLNGDGLVREFLEETGAPSTEDHVVEQLCVRYHVGERDRTNVVQLAVVILSVTCLLYVLMRHATSAPGDAHHDQRGPQPSEISLAAPAGEDRAGSGDAFHQAA